MDLIDALLSNVSTSKAPVIVALHDNSHNMLFDFNGFVKGLVIRVNCLNSVFGEQNYSVHHITERPSLHLEGNVHNAIS